jgi:hypothetical protein
VPILEIDAYNSSLETKIDTHSYELIPSMEIKFSTIRGMYTVTRIVSIGLLMIH